MGYETHFSLCIHKNDTQQPDNEIIEEIFDKLIEKGIISNRDQFDEGIRWYDWQEEFTEISKSFPGVVINLDGTGEDSDDLWEAYFLDGKAQVERAEITFGDYDPEKLK